MRNALRSERSIVRLQVIDTEALNEADELAMLCTCLCCRARRILLLRLLILLCDSKHI